MDHMSDRDVSAYLDGDHYRVKRIAQRTRRKSVLPAAFVAGIFAVLAFFAGGAIAGSEISSFISPLLETLGGTHQTTYTTGDILYASGSNTLSKLAIGSTNNVLTVTSGLPAWGAGSGVSSTILYGDGSDGSVTWDGSTTLLGLAPSSSVYTLTRDIYMTSCTVNSGVFIVTNGFRVFCYGTLTNNGTIKNNGIDGGNGSGTTAGSGGTGTGGGSIGAGSAGGAGGAGAANNGSIGSAEASALGGAGGHGGDAGANTGGAGGTLNAPTSASASGYHALPAIIQGYSTSSTLYGGGSGGGGGADTASHAGGGGGSGGGAVIIAAKSIVNTSGTISANGGNGGNGDAGTGGRGAGGGGGIVWLVYNTYTGNAATATKGANGTGSATNATAAADGLVISVNNNQ